MISSEEIQDLFKSEQNRNFKKIISGFYYTESQYNGNPVENEI